MTRRPHEADGGVCAVSLQELRALLDAVDAGHVRAPLTESELQSRGFANATEAAAPLFGLERKAVSAMLRAVIAERVHATERRIELVWTGPEAIVSTARDTAVVVAELFASARTHVLVAGFRFDHGADILRPLHGVMRDHAVRADVFVDVQRDAGVDDAMQGFLAENWPFGSPEPTLYYDRRITDQGVYASLHAKCVVVDERRALVTSANFTDRGQTRNIEVGALIEDPAFARSLLQQWRGLGDAGMLQRWSSGNV